MLELASYIDGRLRQWARRKYKTLKTHKRRSVEWLGKMREVFPQMFAHWALCGRTVG